MYWEHEYNKAIRSGKWKAVCDETGTKWELFDIENDRMENTDLSAENRTVIDELIAKWCEWAWKYGVYPKEHDVKK